MRKLLTVLRVLDAHDGQVSLTAVFAWVAATQVVLDCGAPQVWMAGVALLGMTIKRAAHFFLRQPSHLETQFTDLSRRFDELRERSNALGIRIGLGEPKR